VPSNLMDPISGTDFGCRCEYLHLTTKLNSDTPSLHAFPYFAFNELNLFTAKIAVMLCVQFLQKTVKLYIADVIKHRVLVAFRDR
jgi:hypothetical protein